jgi:peroxiredoxin
MNRIKSVFIGFYPMIAMGITGSAGWQSYHSRDWLAWAGPLLTTLPFMMFLSRIMMFKNVARTSGAFPGFNALAVAGVLLSAYVSLLRNEPGHLVPVALAFAGAVGFALYSLWYSRLGRKPSAKLQVGRVFPDFGLKKTDGSTFHTRELLGVPALIFFFRGNWCPLCMAQIKEVAARYRDIGDTGARVILISPQPHAHTIELARRFNVPFEFLTDAGNQVARALDIEMRNGLPMGMGMLGYEADTVFPTVLVLDPKGVIRWLDQTDNYRVRPEPGTFLPILRQLATARP